MERVKALLNDAGDITPELRSILMSLASFIHDLAFAAASNQRPVKRLYTVDEAATYLRTHAQGPVGANLEREAPHCSV